MRIKELDGLRGIAVIAVLSEHYMSWLPMLGSGYGWLGVDLFLVLSGFLITSILLELRDKQHYFKVFYARRAFRIFPPYYLAILVYLMIAFATGMTGSLKLWMEYVFYYSSLFVGQPAAVLARPPVLPAVVVPGLAVLWSLSVEEIYYTMWAPIVRYTNQKGFTTILTGMLLMAPLLRWWLHTPAFPEIYTFYCRMDGLAYGSAIALLIRARRLHPVKWMALDRRFDYVTAALLPVTLGFWLMTRGNRSSLLVCTLGLVLADVSFALIVYALIRNADGMQWWTRMFRAKWLRSIGMISYSLYLFHYPLRIVAGELVERLHLSRHADVVAAVLLGLALSFGVAYGLWYGMESRILRWKDRRVPSEAHL